jgi:thiosulfate dehydrogenase
MESIEKRINDCFERSLNGKPLKENSKEMRAMVAYMKFLGENVKKGEKAKGSGFKELPFLTRAADPVKGKGVYDLRCASCHQPNGQGIIDGIGQSYVYPPLWGPHSFNDAAGLSRISNMAKYVKYNMPLGVSHDAPELSDEDAWDVAAYIESKPRPHKAVPKDWPDISKKPIDHPFGPYADKFSEQQHKYGPFTAMKKAKK